MPLVTMKLTPFPITKTFAIRNTRDPDIVSKLPSPISSLLDKIQDAYLVTSADLV